jgi:hypothetical protein
MRVADRHLWAARPRPWLRLVRLVQWVRLLQWVQWVRLVLGVRSRHLLREHEQQPRQPQRPGGRAVAEERGGGGGGGGGGASPPRPGPTRRRPPGAPPPPPPPLLSLLLVPGHPTPAAFPSLEVRVPLALQHEEDTCTAMPNATPTAAR